MLIPYNVDRVARRPPYYTYGLIAINTLLFLVTVFVANFNLAFDRVEGEKAVDSVLTSERSAVRTQVRELLDALGRRGINVPPSPQDEQIDRIIARLDKNARKALAEQIIFEQAHDAGGYRRLWQVSHADDSFVLEPHYSALDTFAYSAATPSLLGLLGSMFLHGSFEHLIGNMLYLWVFGRALEDTLGPLIYIGAYVLCGIAAILLYHIMTVQFTPHSVGLPMMGASGAIAGVLGLFAMRFYRTPVRISYLAIVFAVSLVAARLGWLMLGLTGALIGLVAVWAIFAACARQWTWGTFKMASAWAIGIWLLMFNLVPGLATLFSTEKAGGTAYWAHIGGFMIGMLYATLIGSKEEGSREYLLEDAQKALAESNVESALARAENLLQREPDNAGAYEVIAKARDQRGSETSALDNSALDSYEMAIDKYLQAGRRDDAVRTYLHALHKNSGFIMPPARQFILGSHMARNADYQNAAATLAKIPFTFPEAAEGELSLLRAAQIYGENLDQPQMALHLLETLLQRYPDTQWMPQVQRGLQATRERMNP